MVFRSAFVYIASIFAPSVIKTNNSNGVYVSFSGGKDSTVLLDLVRRMYKDVPAVFIDTGLEYPELRRFVKTFDNVVRIKPEMNFRKVIETYGYPVISKEVSQKIYEVRKNPNGYAANRFDDNSEYNKKYKNRFSMAKWSWLRDSDIPISNMCCNVMKKKPAAKFEKSSGLKPIIATMACESRLRQTEWRKHGCNSFDSKRAKSQPLSFWTEQDIFEYIVRFIKPKYDQAWYEVAYASGSRRKRARKFLRKKDYSRTGIASVYGEIIQDNNGKYITTKCNRTGCVFCMYGCHLEKEPNRFQRLKQTHPKLWEYCMKPWNEGGLGLKKVLEFIKVPYN